MAPSPGDWLSQSRQAVADTLGSLGDSLASVLNQRTLKIAVTGLSRSGKTVFITALIYQLLHGYGAKYGAKIVPQTALQLPTFDYPGSVAALFADPSRWPTPTSQISTLKLALRYPQSGLYGYLAQDGVLLLDLIDYPGEWLLDLALLGWSFEEWTTHSNALNATAPRHDLSAAWRAQMQAIDLRAPQDDGALKQAARAYAAFLRQAKADYQLSLLHPGRFLMPGDLEHAPLLDFCPTETLMDDPPPGSNYAALRQRYAAYKEQVVRKFYREHFAQFDRQIVLVDLLRVLNRGQYAFDDMSQALDLTLQSFRYGKNGLLNWLIGSKIDRVLFAATKADHVTRNQIGNLERLLRQILRQPQTAIQFEGVTTDVMALASVRCTTDGKAQYQGREISVIRGLPVGREAEVSTFPGEVPADLMGPDEWQTSQFQFMDFRPPRLTKQQPLPQLNFDKTLNFLIGDYLP